MALDLSKVVNQITGMVDNLKSRRDDRQQKLQNSVDILNSQSNNTEQLEKKIEASKSTWLVARLVEPIDRHYAPQPAPKEFTVIATDGSHIDVDRHQPTHCYLINIGGVVLKYGPKPDAILDSIPHLYASDEELFIQSPTTQGREQPVEGALLGIKRGVEECKRLAELCANVPAGGKALGLIDGTLIMWSLAGDTYPDFVSDLMLEKGFLAALEQIRKLNDDREIPVASYISYPRSSDVVNALKVALCPRDKVDSDKCPECKTRECDFVDGVRDRELFSAMLQNGERSALFISPSKIQKRYGKNLVYFFYLKLDEEIARIEIPQWAAQDEKRLNLVHTLILDQCKRGRGYPAALGEAHEKAVITGADRENFWQMVESELISEHLHTAGSAKSQSKKTRWV
jgi:hypothetical protein